MLCQEVPKQLFLRLLQISANGCPLLLNFLKRFLEKEKSSLVVGGVGALLDNQKKKMAGTLKDKFSSWIKVPLKKRLEEKFQCPVFLENDAALAALGEAVFGAGKDSQITAYLTFSTGINGARVTNKKIDASFGDLKLETKSLILAKATFLKKLPFRPK